MNYRNRALLNLAYTLPCQLQIPNVCEGGMGEPCHANWSEYGKGGAQKSHDCFFVSGCRKCHREIDQGRTLTKEQRKQFWEYGYRRTMLGLWKEGAIAVVHPIIERIDNPVLAITEANLHRGYVRVAKLRKNKTGHHNGLSTQRSSKTIRRGQKSSDEFLT